MRKRFLCSSLYQAVLPYTELEDVLFLPDDALSKGAPGIDLAGIEGAILQPRFIQKGLLDNLPDLRFVQATGAGVDAADLQEVKKRELVLCNSRGVMSSSIAEDVFAKILFFSRKIRHVEFMRNKHAWDTFGQDQWMCTCYDDLEGRTLGIMGFGSIGTEIAKRAAAFSMKIIILSAHEHKDQRISGCYLPEEKEAFLSQCDYAVICLPLTKSTWHFVDSAAFSAMKKSAVLVNVARGAIVDTDALIFALQEREISGAALDVFEEEPLPEMSPLWECPNLFLTSHKAGMGDTWKKKIGNLFLRNMDHYRNGDPLENVISLS